MPLFPCRKLWGLKGQNSAIRIGMIYKNSGENVMQNKSPVEILLINLNYHSAVINEDDFVCVCVIFNCVYLIVYYFMYFSYFYNENKFKQNNLKKIIAEEVKLAL